MYEKQRLRDQEDVSRLNKELSAMKGELERARSITPPVQTHAPPTPVAKTPELKSKSTLFGRTRAG